jgi:hypothetical protein
MARVALKLPADYPGTRWAIHYAAIHYAAKVERCKASPALNEKGEGDE